MDSEQLKPILEAALLAAPKPMTTLQLAELFDLVERPALEAVSQALLELVEASADDSRGVELVEVASGFRYQIKSEVFPHLASLWTERQSRYSRALLETMALIAYRQPITRGEIEQIRGVGVATSILRTIEERDWIRVVGHRDVPGHPALYGTTKAFLDYFKLKSLDELPPLSSLSDLEAMEPELLLELGGPLLTEAEPLPAPDTVPDQESDDDAEVTESEQAAHEADETAEDEPAATDTDTDVDTDIDTDAVAADDGDDESQSPSEPTTEPSR